MVEELCRELDPVGCHERKAHRLQRRQYMNPGPNFAWHTDGYDKLKPYGFPIHGCVDGQKANEDCKPLPAKHARSIKDGL